jgi:hypothetical protein
MKLIKIILSILFFGLVFAACGGPSYPKKNITDSIENKLKKEFGVEGKAELVGKTLYLDVKLQGLITKNSEELTPLLKKIYNASFLITRAALSSDANIDYLVVQANDPSWKLFVRLIQRLEDVKGLLYSRISVTDYEDRAIFEKETNLNADAAGQNTVQMRNDMNIKEFIGRLIASQVNMLSLKNPFLSLIFGNADLSFSGLENDELVLSVNKKLAPASVSLFKKIVGEEAKKVLVKFGQWQPKTIKIIGQDNNLIFVDMNKTAEMPLKK